MRLKSFLLRHDVRYDGRANWSAAHVRYLQDKVTLPTPVQQRVFQDVSGCANPRVFGELGAGQSAAFGLSI